MQLPFLAKATTGGISVTLLGLWDGFGVAVQLLIILMAIDIMAGFMLAAAGGKVDIPVMWKGVTKKVVVLLVVGMAAAFDTQISVPLRDVVAGFYAGVEGISILAHATEAGVPVPNALTDIFRPKQEQANGK